MNYKRRKHANYHQVRHDFDPSRSVVWREICRYLQRHVPPKESVLDLGAGYGDFLRHINATKKYGLELGNETLCHWPDDATAIIQSALKSFPLEDASISTVFASNFFEHFLEEEICRILEEIRRVLKSAGSLIVIQPNFRLQPGRYYDDYTHKTPFSEVSFGDFLRSMHWHIKHTEGRFLPFSLKSSLPKWGWLVKLYLALPLRPFAGQFLLIAEKP